jgi:large subunit ribosomal protein L13
MKQDQKRLLKRQLKACFQKNKLGKQMFKKLKVFSGSEHEHESQQPQVWEPKI